MLASSQRLCVENGIDLTLIDELDLDFNFFALFLSISIKDVDSINLRLICKQTSKYTKMILQRFMINKRYRCRFLFKPFGLSLE